MLEVVPTDVDVPSVELDVELDVELVVAVVVSSSVVDDTVDGSLTVASATGVAPLSVVWE